MSRINRSVREEFPPAGLTSSEIGQLRSILLPVVNQIEGTPIIWVFGSRAGESFKKYSDVDLLFSKEFTSKQIATIRQSLEDSNLPYLFDLVHEPNMEPSYRENIEMTRRVWLRK